MPGRIDIARALNGSLMLLRGDGAGLAWFDLSIEGFWRSLRIAWLLAPIYALILLLDVSAGTPSIAYVLINLIGYGIGWFGFLLLMLPLARHFGLTNSYLPYAIAYNWSQMVMLMALLPLTLLQALPQASTAFSGLLSLAFLIASIFYSWRIATLALRAPPLLASDIVVLDFLFSLLLHLGLERLLRSPF